MHDENNDTTHYRKRLETILDNRPKAGANCECSAVFLNTTGAAVSTN